MKVYEKALSFAQAKKALDMLIKTADSGDGVSWYTIDYVVQELKLI